MEKHMAVCPYCGAGCKLNLIVDDGMVIGAEGLDGVTNEGELCLKGLSGFDFINDTKILTPRILHPMIRREKGGELERVTWDEAYDLICDKFAEIKEEFGPWAVLFASGTGRDVANGMYRMAYSYGSPNIAYQQTGVACYGPRITATSIMMGNYCVPDCSMYFADRYDNPQWKPPGVIFVWGNTPLVSNADGNVGHWMVDCMKRGSRFVVVDPRITWIAAKADLFLRLRPGTDAALALALCNVIIVTAPPSSPISSKSETSDTFSK